MDLTNLGDIKGRTVLVTMKDSLNNNDSSFNKSFNGVVISKGTNELILKNLSGTGFSDPENIEYRAVNLHYVATLDVLKENLDDDERNDDEIKSQPYIVDRNLWIKEK